MSKRFIDTGLFDDDWFMDLSKDAKILWLYFITKCDHAGIIKLNVKLCQLQTGIKDLETVRQQLGNRCITVSEQLFFIPKFVEYQYPGFPNCNFQTAKSAVAILEKYGLIKDSCLTVPQELPNSYSIGKGNGNSKGNDKEEEKIIYADFVSMTTAEYEKLREKYGEADTKKFIETLNNYKGAKGVKYKSDYLAILNWVVEKVKQANPKQTASDPKMSTKYLPNGTIR